MVKDPLLIVAEVGAAFTLGKDAGRPDFSLGQAGRASTDFAYPRQLCGRPVEITQGVRTILLCCFKPKLDGNVFFMCAHPRWPGSCLLLYLLYSPFRISDIACDLIVFVTLRKRRFGGENRKSDSNQLQHGTDSFCDGPTGGWRTWRRPAAMASGSGHSVMPALAAVILRYLMLFSCMVQNVRCNEGDHFAK